MEEYIENNENTIIPGEDEKLMDHDYDGIRELDNPPPRWIMAIFYITIAFSVFYGAYYFWLGIGDHQDAEYARKSMKHDQKYQIASLSADDMVLLTDVNDIEEGKTIYKAMNCFACHGMNGEGNAVGPNLTDDFAINGCDIKSTFEIIKIGKPAKGMTAFKGQISDDKIQKVSSYVISLVGTNPENAKEAQGVKCK